MSNSFFDVIFDKSTGLMTSINVRNLNFRSEFKEDYAAYEASGGAYLFLPKGPAKSFASSSHPIIVIQVLNKSIDFNFVTRSFDRVRWSPKQ